MSNVNRTRGAGSWANVSARREEPASRRAEPTGIPEPRGWVPRAPRRGQSSAPVVAERRPAPPSGQIFQLSGLGPSENLAVKDSKYKGTGFGGSATIHRADATGLDVTVKGTKWGIPAATVNIRFDLQPDGTVHFRGRRVDQGAEEGEPDSAATVLSVERVEPNRTVFMAPAYKGADGKQVPARPVTVSYDPTRRRLSIEYDRNSITLQQR